MMLKFLMQYVKDFIDSLKSLNCLSAVVQALQYQNSCSVGLDRLKGPDGWAPELGEAEPLQPTELWGDNQGYHRVVNQGCLHDWQSHSSQLLSWQRKASLGRCGEHTHRVKQNLGYSCTTWNTLQRKEMFLEYAAISSHVPASVTPQWITSTAPYLFHDILHLSLLPPWNISADFSGNKTVSSTDTLHS